MGDIVSRSVAPGPPPQSRLEALFEAWRALLTRVVIGWSRLFAYALRGARAASRRTRTYVAETRSGSPAARARLSIMLGLLAVAVGVAATVLVAAPEARMRTLPTALVAAMWTCGRLVAMRLAAGSTATRSHTVAPAWAAGALLHVIAVSSGLRLVAWVGGLLLTYRKLRISGSSTRDAITVAGWGYGLEVAGFVLLSLARSVQVAIVWLGGSSG